MLVLGATAAEVGEWDGFLPDCVLDPAVHAAASLPRPIHGIGRLAIARTPSGAGVSWRAVARNEPIARELDRLAGHYGLATDGETTWCCRSSVDDIADDVGSGRRPGLLP